MNIDYNWGQPVVKKVGRVRKFLRSVFCNTNVPMHMSNHYRRESFHQEDDPQGKLF